MQIDLEVAFPSLEIVAAAVRVRDPSARRLPVDHRPLRRARRAVDRPRLHPQGPRAVRRPAWVHPHHGAAAGDGSGRGAVHLVDGCGRREQRRRVSGGRRAIGAGADGRRTSTRATCGPRTASSSRTSQAGGDVRHCRSRSPSGAAELGLEPTTSGCGSTADGDVRVASDPFGLRSLTVEQAGRGPGASGSTTRPTTRPGSPTWTSRSRPSIRERLIEVAQTDVGYPVVGRQARCSRLPRTRSSSG